VKQRSKENAARAAAYVSWLADLGLGICTALPAAVAAHDDPFAQLIVACLAATFPFAVPRTIQAIERTAVVKQVADRSGRAPRAIATLAVLVGLFWIMAAENLFLV
jgi:hypothetical protein